MSNVNDNFDDELLSAYVDGELTAEERAAVEERLRTDPQAAELVSELRALSSAIKSLPRETLGRDLRASIQAELDEAHADEGRQVIPLSEPLDPPRGFYRGFLWSTVAIAAALMLMFLQYREQESERDVAVAAKDKTAAVEEHTAGNNRRREMLDDGELPPMGELRSVEPPRDAAKPAAGIGGGMGGFGVAAGGSAAEPLEAPTSAPALEGRATATDALASTADKEEALGLEGMQADASGAAQRRVGAAEAETEALAETIEEQVAQSDALSPQPAEMTQEAAELALSGEAGAVVSGREAVAPESASSLVSSLGTVELEVRTADGVRRFSQLLAESNFRAPAESPADGPRETSSPSQSSALDRDAHRFYYGQQRSGQLPADAAGDRTVHVVVEGTPAQIDQLVYSYRQQPEVFAEVDRPESIVRRAREFRREATPSAGAPLRQLEAQPQAQAEDAAGQAARPAASSYGLAWFFTPPDMSSAEARYSKQSEAKLKGANAEADVQLGAPVEVLSEGAQSTREGGAVARPEVERLAKQLQSPPAEGRVRLKFVLRPAPQPAATAEPATAEP